MLGNDHSLPCEIRVRKRIQRFAIHATLTVRGVEEHKVGLHIMGIQFRQSVGRFLLQDLESFMNLQRRELLLDQFGQETGAIYKAHHGSAATDHLDTDRARTSKKVNPNRSFERLRITRG